MKSENVMGDPIWSHSVELLSQEECLPVIGSCQVSSILQNLEPTHPVENPENMDLIILPVTDIKLTDVENSQNNYIILSESGDTRNKHKAFSINTHVSNSKKKNENFEDMLYFVCNLCPFLCTKDVKITEHLENAHKNKSAVKLPQLKCPACANIFFHRMSLRSHLIHDHGVGNSDLSQIIQAVIYYSNKHKSNEKEKSENKQNEIKRNCELNTKNSLSPNQTQNEDLNGTENLELQPENCDISMQKEDNNMVVLPQVDLVQNNSEKIFGNLMKHTDPVTKYLDHKQKNKCIIPTCKVQLQEVNKLKYHLDCHIDSGFKCPECNEKFLFWKPLTSHLWRLHKIDMDLYSCDKCEYKTFSLSKLNHIHKMIHSEIKAFSCEICNKLFKNMKQLRNHKIIHKDKVEKLLHVCEVCTKGFTERRQLKVHMDVVHKKIKPYSCTSCGYKASSRSALKMHTRQHTGEKPFSCDTCTYTTSDHNSLRRHKLRHTGQKPYKCSYCSYACIQSSTYKVHLKTKHPGLEKDLMFTCPECQYRSVNKEMYSMHMVTIHKIKAQQTS